MNEAALGFRVKSGWAMAVLLSGASSPPKVIDRRRVDLADQAVPESTQPFHAGLGLPQAAGAKVVARLVRCVERSSARVIAGLIKHYRAGGHRIVGAGIVVGSTVDPQTIRNDHIRAHAEEGRLFRVVIEDALKQAGLSVSITRERELMETATKALGISERKLRAELIAMGKAVEGSWRAEEKAATLVAWMAMAPRSRSRIQT
jgi:hypothetical protein